MKLKAVGWWCPNCSMFLHLKGESCEDGSGKIYYNCKCKIPYKERERLKNNWLKRVYIKSPVCKPLDANFSSFKY